MLDRARTGAAAYFFEECLPGGSVCISGANLDQLVTFETAVDFRENRGRQAFAADQYQRGERMCPRFQLASLARG